VILEKVKKSKINKKLIYLMKQEEEKKIFIKILNIISDKKDYLPLIF
jgi:hypothetical protein